jgi:hypothetical protein
MDWLVEVNDDFLYGPTTIGAIQEFLSNGEINPETIVINCREGSSAPIKDHPVFTNTPSKTIGIQPSPSSQAAAGADMSSAGNGGALSQSMQKHIRDLELQMLEKNRHIEMLETQYHELREKYVEATGSDPFK